jgi:hypothetical protein
MSTITRRTRCKLALLVIGAALVTTGPSNAAVTADAGAAIPQGGGANNIVIAPTFADGSTFVRSHTQLSQSGGNTVASANIATALATACTGCHATAVAVQVVLVTGRPQYFLPQNFAVAVNSGCIACGSFAYAWQYTPSVDRPVSLSASSLQEVQDLKAEIAATAGSIVPDSLADDIEIQERLDALTSQLKSVVDAAIENAGAHATGAPEKHVERTSDA